MLHRALIPVLGPVLLGGCDKVESDFDLDLSLRTPLDQRPFDANPSLKLVQRDARGTEIWPLEEVDGAFVLDGSPPLVNAALGVLLQVPPDSDDTYDPATLHAWGEAGPFDLALEDTLDIEVLVPLFAEIGDLDVLPTGASAFGSALALTSARDAWLIGGANTPGGPGLSRLLFLDDLNAGSWRFEDAGSLPAVEGQSARYGATASVVDSEGVEAVLILGGRPDGTAPTGNLATALLLDALTGEPMWSGAGMDHGRSEHAAVPLENGRILVLGGYEDDGAEPGASFEIFDPNFLAFDPGAERLRVPSRGFATASLGPDGVLVCGGAALVGDLAPVRTPSAACDRVSILGNVQAMAPLPTALSHLAMVSVGDGKVLATGGIGQPLAGTVATATSEAWVFDLAANAWVTVSPMGSARAMHRLVPTPDGRALVVGGTAAIGPLESDIGAVVDCVERFDPATGAFEQMECTATGSGAHPVVSALPEGHALVVSGQDGAGTGGRAYGVLGLGPDLE